MYALYNDIRACYSSMLYNYVTLLDHMCECDVALLRNMFLYDRTNDRVLGVRSVNETCALLLGCVDLCMCVCMHVCMYVCPPTEPRTVTDPYHQTEFCAASQTPPRTASAYAYSTTTATEIRYVYV